MRSRKWSDNNRPEVPDAMNSCRGYRLAFRVTWQYSEMDYLTLSCQDHPREGSWQPPTLTSKVRGIWPHWVAFLEPLLSGVLGPRSVLQPLGNMRYRMTRGSRIL